MPLEPKSQSSRATSASIANTETAAEFPLVRRFSRTPQPEAVFRRLCSKSHCLFLDSSLRHHQLGRYSFVTSDPFDVFRIGPDSPAPLEDLRKRMSPFCVQRRRDLPPFQGGAAGMLGYDLGRSFERLTRPQFDAFSIPAILVGLYDVVVAWDHETNEAWIISQGFPELEPSSRRRRAQQRLDQFTSWIASAPCEWDPVNQGSPVEIQSPQHPVGTSVPLTSNFSRTEYEQAVQQTIDYIRAGDVFQVNLSQRLLCETVEPAAQLYLKLRDRSPSTFGGYFDLGEFQIVSASPERFLSVIDDRVETRPIKGTRRCTSQPEADLFAAEELQNSEKDRSENIMICDLMRNDLSRVCQPDSVRVTQLCGLETYGYVQHLVSAVEGQLQKGSDALDLIAATFPGGSISGAPKVRAMEIITELESVSRGAYCGSLGFLGFDGTMDLNILIRTITAGKGWWQLPVGGGIVAQSSPRAEYEETWHKAEGLLRALRS